MLPEIENLLHLQEADKEIRRLQDEIAELPKRVAAIEHKLAGYQSCNWKKLRPPSKPTKPPAASTKPPSPTFAARFPSIATSPST